MLKHLNTLKDEKETHTERLEKAIFALSLIKSGYPVGTVRTWRGTKFKKIAPNKWRRIYDSETRGAKMSIARLKKKVANANSIDELFDIVMNNTHRFSDANGKPLAIVKELKAAVDEKKKALNADKPSTKAQIDDWKKQNKQKAIKFLGTVTPEIVKLAKSAGLDIEGYKHKVTDDFARHVIKKHGNKKEEAKRGQIAVTQEDLDNIKTVMNTPDIVVAGVKKNGKDRIVLVKNTEHGSILVEEVLSGRRNKTLNAKTFWIMDKTVDEAKIQKILTNTNGYDVSKIKVASLTGTNSVLSSSKDEGGSNSAVKTATTKGQDHKGDLSNNSSIADKADSVNGEINFKAKTESTLRKYIDKATKAFYVHRGERTYQAISDKDLINAVAANVLAMEAYTRGWKYDHPLHNLYEKSKSYVLMQLASKDLYNLMVAELDKRGYETTIWNERDHVEIHYKKSK